MKETPGDLLTSRMFLEGSGGQEDTAKAIKELGPKGFTGTEICLTPMITGMEEPIFSATEVKKAGQVFKLRDDSGYPVWAPPSKKHEK